ncbi:extracellular solute-binding protein [Kribbella jejuensis]|uniref:Carbohydrate ABC transporter substrate-binding protein (CUT1 family) n=1 Tax=Kribbella jejuensis TaxID=236068 RepID=A0A542ERR7_9ACTN|nr:sugar ABC transporter substrate-binding protein [Kribbella jejuensis]TQJ18030.1 carbohydrate ABC transporter substrate-binding protein (CUT1 family) [Kribbella jejuensis]
MNRRLSLITSVTSVLALAASLAACGSKDASPAAGSSAGSCARAQGKVELTYWGFGLPAPKIVQEFNRTHPNIHVTMKDVSTNSVQQMTNALKAGTAPDVGMVQYSDLPSFRLLNGLRDISACPGVADTRGQVIPWTWAQVTFGGGGVYGMPQDTGPLALYYRKDILAKYGLAVPKTWADYEAIGKRLKAADPSAHLAHFASGDAYRLLSLMWQNGARPFQYADNHLTVDLTGGKARQVVEYWQRLIDEHLVATTVQELTPAEFKAMDNGTLVTMLGASWLSGVMQANAPGASGKWAVAPLPQWDTSKPAGANYGGSANTVFASSKHPAEAAEFASWVATNSYAQKQLIAVGSVPPSVAALGLPEMDVKPAYFGAEPIWHVFSDSSKTVDTSFQWPPNMTTVTNSMSDAITSTLKGSTTLSAELERAQQKIVTDLKSRGVDARAGGQ